MKASELMHGNIVLYEYEGQKIPARVVEIYRSSVLVKSVSGEYEPIEIDDGKIFPIPLTPEILEKNGFQRSLYWHYYNARFDTHELTIQLGYANRIEYVRIVERSGENCIPSEDSNVYLPHVKYVHQLQQALRLCGIEKEIEL